ncbi:PREDICTED: uncharacterized protein LOC107355766 isoform X2 [Acropora digitifera]|uniref:uncharacterized protein LOC107355766 isoform X2 n=1 Tax=Acropora digitifera TaxID=70779 RepID=UPI00077A6232|nr:PREDICTED: uncharacterized protein LOC107355766 isoform X2 [Acropora digitifera]
MSFNAFDLFVAASQDKESKEETTPAESDDNSMITLLMMKHLVVNRLNMMMSSPPIQKERMQQRKAFKPKEIQFHMTKSFIVSQGNWHEGTWIHFEKTRTGLGDTKLQVWCPQRLYLI